MNSARARVTYVRLPQQGAKEAGPARPVRPEHGQELHGRHVGFETSVPSQSWAFPVQVAASPGAAARQVTGAIADLRPGWAAEPKWDGYRAQLAVYAGGRVLLRSRRGTDMTASFPEIRAAALAQLPEDTGLDGDM